MTRTFRFPIEFGHLLTFRRAIGHDDGGALDGRHDAITAPPTFVTAGAQFDPESRLRPQRGVRWVTATGSNETDAGDGQASNGRLLHAEQHYEYHRDVRPGQVLTVTTRDGATWTKEGRSGTMIFNEILTEYRDQDGELIVSGRAVRVKLPAKVDG
ncbi:MaoC family dehydratase N-terminal domain-containing protein [Rhodococcus sp. T2V]|uniref:FAS1-like dehydratase domain-containing protein n=1 Tax=Rhodococcus sp. T2V TaxID=3034164 RepID=UPI0023E248DB|nr:MaoC family dehydratase N-terminal domain-containing protein [Rhodococcus sp. T2V]MDF3310059.1 MaoC family dehydratase N-terminal domain-containing protein [Rhodococcus sp. T2V]